MASTDARPVPRKNAAFRVTFPILDADGDLVTGGTGPDSEVSKDGGTFADCTNEATEIAASSGVYFLDLTASEMNADCVAVIVKTTSVGAKTTLLVFYPEEAGDFRADVTHWNGTPVPTAEAGGPFVIRRNTAAGGANSSITLDASASTTDDFYVGCGIEIVGGTGVGQLRLITDYVGSTKVATVGRPWVANPDSSSVFRVFAGELPATTGTIAFT